MKIAKLFFWACFLVLPIFFGLGLAMKQAKETNKYNLSFEGKNSIILAISAAIVKPIIEVYLDSRLADSGFLDSIKAKNFCDKMLVKSIIKEGSGRDIICGQKIIVNASGKNISAKNLEYTVGSSQKKILNIAPIGMKNGELSTVVVPGFLIKELFGKDAEKDSNTAVAIEILDILDDYPQEIDNVTVFTSKITNQKAKMCGDNISLNYKIKDIKLKEIDSGKLEFKIGARQVPILFDSFAIGMQPETNRTLIANSLLTNLDYMQQKTDAVIVEMSINQ